jgi:hypothetical protein
MLQEKHRYVEFFLDELLKEVLDLFRRYELLSQLPRFCPQREANNCAVEGFAIPIGREEMLEGLEMIANGFDRLWIERKASAAIEAERRLGVKDNEVLSG